jgi:hypothetical protein
VNYARVDQDDVCFFLEGASKAAAYEFLKFPSPSRPPLDTSLDQPAPTASLYVFRNGVRGDGPNGFQRPVLERTVDVAVDRVITRTLLFVTWTAPASARELTAAQEIRSAEAASQLAIDSDKSAVKLRIVAVRKR